MGGKLAAAGLAAAVTLAGCSGTGTRPAAAAGISPSPAGTPSAAYDDSNVCSAFSDLLASGVPSDVEASYSAQYGAPLSGADFVTDSAWNADPHLKALAWQWHAAVTADPASPGFFQNQEAAKRAVEAWCDKQGYPVTSP